MFVLRSEFMKNEKTVQKKWTQKEKEELINFLDVLPEEMSLKDKIILYREDKNPPVSDNSIRLIYNSTKRKISQGDIDFRKGPWSEEEEKEFLKTINDRQGEKLIAIFEDVAKKFNRDPVAVRMHYYKFTSKQEKKELDYMRNIARKKAFMPESSILNDITASDDFTENLCGLKVMSETAKSILETSEKIKNINCDSIDELNNLTVDELLVLKGRIETLLYIKNSK